MKAGRDARSLSIMIKMIQAKRKKNGPVYIVARGVVSGPVE